MGLTHWGDVPIYSGLYYNNERPTAATLHRLAQKERQSDVLVIASDMPSVTDGALMHLTSMLSEMRGSGMEVFWYSAYPGSGFRDFGLALRRFLLDLWKRNDIRVISERDFVALSFEIAGCNSTTEYFERNIRALTTRSPDQEIMVIIDLQAVHSKRQQAEFLELGRKFLLTPSKKWRGAIAIVSSDLEEHELRFGGPEAEIAKLIESSRTGVLEPKGQANLSEHFSGVAELVHPLIVLNQPAQRQVLDYVLQHASKAQSEARELIENEVLWRLGNERVRVSPSAMNLFFGLQPKIRPPFKDTVPNGARILSFQAPERLGHVISSLDEINQAAGRATLLVDCFAAAVATQAHGSASKSALQACRETFEEAFKVSPDNQSLLSNIEMNTRSLLCYSSQMLLTSFTLFGENFFPLLEEITYGYAAFTQSCHGERAHQNYEASRWITNLGYIYDEVAVKQGYRLNGSRSSFYKEAATYLSNLQPSDLTAWAEVRYSEAWQLHDAGDSDAAISLFEETARRLEQEFSRMVPANQIMKIMAQELSVIAFTLAPDRLTDNSAECIAAMLEGYGSHIDLAWLHAAVSDGNLKEIAPAKASADTVVLASFQDLHIALLVAQALRSEFKRAPKVILAPYSGNENCDLALHIQGMLAIVIGAPDTPGAIGEFISERDHELVRLYQLRLLGNFGASIKSPNDAEDTYFLSSCGLAGNFYAWQAFVDRYGNTIRQENSPMDAFLIKDLLLVPLATALETRVFNAVVDFLVGKLKGVKKDEASAALQHLHKVKPEEMEQAVSALSGDVKTSLTEIASPSSVAEALSEVMATLRLGDLDINQLHSIADFAYILASRFQEKAAPASAEQMSFNNYVRSFRQKRADISEIRDIYLASGRFDKQKFNEYSEDLVMSLRNFKDVVNKSSVC